MSKLYMPQMLSACKVLEELDLSETKNKILNVTMNLENNLAIS